LTLLVFALAIPVFLTIAISYADLLRDRRAAELEGSARTATNGASILAAFLRDLDGTTFATANLLAVAPLPLDQPTRGPYLASLMQRYPELRAFFITDPSGKVVASGNGEGIGVDLSTRSYIQALKSGADKVWSGSIVGLQSGDITVAFARTIGGGSVPVKGYLVCAFYPEKVMTRLKPVLPPAAQLIVIDERARVVYDSSATQPATTEIDVSNAFGVKEALAGDPVEIDGVATPVGSEARFGAIVPVATVGWALSVTRPAASLQSVIYGPLLGDTIAVLAALAVAAFIATLLANRLALPLRELSTVASSIARGERPVIPAASGGIEVEQLSAAMRTMQAAVAKREDEMRLLAAAGELLSGSLDYEEVLQRAARVAIPVFADWVVVDIVEDGRISRAAVAVADPARAERARRLRDRYPPSQPDPARRGEASRGPVARAIATRDPVLVREVTPEFLRSSARDDEELALYNALGPRSSMTQPLHIGDRVIGAVTFITSESGRRYDDADLDLGRQLARRMALSIENARLYYEVQQSLKTRDDFLAAVAHELKTPLTIISASTQLLQRRSGNGEADPSTTRIRGAVSRMTAFIEELLELVRRQADPTLELRRAPTDLVQVVRDVVANVGQVGHGQDVIVEAAEPVVGEWDGSRLERAVANLISNAIKYNRQDGRVWIRVATRHTPSGDIAECAVTDEGIGIPEADLPRIFERFTRGANVAGRVAGSGVGLAIVRQVVEQHGGDVVVTSVEGEGSTFTIRLPLAPDAATVAAG
jgi:signal transduction histidine kinase/HAMP domain-containing protein